VSAAPTPVNRGARHSTAVGMAARQRARSDRGSAPAGVEERRLLSGWGRATRSLATVVRPRDADELADALARPSARGVLARGLGRAYGDAAQNAGGRVTVTTGLAAVRGMDASRGEVTVDAGMSLEALARQTMPHGWFPAVVPGTRFVTVGGALAADIHGKNHHVDGGFARHVRAFDLLTPDGDRRRALPGSEEFAATAGGMGLTGVIAEAALQLLPLPSGVVREEVTRAGDLDHLLALMADNDDAYRYSVAWVDAASRRGRGLLLRGDHASAEEAASAAFPAPQPHDAAAFPAPRLRAPRWAPGGLLGRPTVRAFNALWLRRSRPGTHVRLTQLAAYFWPLDGVRGWNRLYGARGLIQYQCVVPPGAEDVLRRILDGAGASTLAVLKRLADGDGPLAFAMRGWTLALDFPAAAPGLDRLLDGFDDLVAEAGGRVYLAKDSRLRPATLRAMYPRLDEWRSVRARLDPNGMMRSDLQRRLDLT
jgi:decaprenylphospho-beta-D-ribofuranose 2-oxidase